MDTPRPRARSDQGRQDGVGHGSVPVVTRNVGRSVGLGAWLALVVVYLLWGSAYLASRLVLPSVPPLLIGGLRFLVGGLLLAALVAVFAGPSGLRMTRAQLGTTALSGLLLPAWGNGLVVLAQQQVASGLAALLIAAVPLHIVILRALTGDRPRAATLVGVGIGLGGLIVLLLAGSSGASGGAFGSAWWGPWVVIVAGIGWAAGTFCTTRMPVPANPFAMAAVQMLVGGVVLTVAALAVGERFDPARMTPTAWWAWAFLAIVVSLGAFSAYGYALAALPVSTVATYAYVNPVVAVLLGMVVIGEHYSPVQFVGGAIVLAAVVVVVVAERPSRTGRSHPGRGNRRGVVAASRT